MNINKTLTSQEKLFKKYIYADFTTILSSLHVVITSGIQFSKPIYPVVLYENDIICIFMIIYENK